MTGQTYEGNQHKPRLLVIDDNTDIVESIANWLKSMGYEIATALNGAEGFASALSFKPHIILLDRGLPDMDGFQVAKNIREHPEGKEMLIIVLSGYAPDPTSPSAYIDHYLTKPPNFSQLMQLIKGFTPINSHAAAEH